MQMKDSDSPLYLTYSCQNVSENYEAFKSVVGKKLTCTVNICHQPCFTHAKLLKTEMLK